MGKLGRDDYDRLPDLSDAACAGEDTNLWYIPDEAGRHDPVTLFAVRSRCGACPVKLACLQHALHNERFGVWGGMTAAERATFLEISERKHWGGYAHLMGKARLQDLSDAFEVVGISPYLALQ